MVSSLKKKQKQQRDMMLWWSILKPLPMRPRNRPRPTSSRMFARTIATCNIPWIPGLCPPTVLIPFYFWRPTKSSWPFRVLLQHGDWEKLRVYTKGLLEGTGGFCCRAKKEVFWFFVKWWVAQDFFQIRWFEDTKKPRPNCGMFKIQNGDFCRSWRIIKLHFAGVVEQGL